MQTWLVKFIRVQLIKKKSVIFSEKLQHFQFLALFSTVSERPLIDENYLFLTKAPFQLC